MVLEDESSVHISVIFTETASQNVLSITSPVNQQLASGNPISGSWQFGPFPAGSPISFFLFSGKKGGPALQRIEGSDGCWFVFFEDLTDNDYNDLVLAVNAIPAGGEFEYSGPGMEARIEPATIATRVREDGTRVTATDAAFVIDYRAVSGCVEEPVEGTLEIHSARTEFHIGGQLHAQTVQGSGTLEFSIPAGTPATTDNKLCRFAVYRAPSGFGTSFETIVRVCADLLSTRVVISTVGDKSSVAPTNAGSDETEIELEVKVLDEDDNALQNRQVELTLEAVPQTGGHLHAPPTTEAARGKLSKTTVNTGSGVVKVKYQSGSASGDRKIRGTSEDAADGEQTITVGVPGLVAMPTGTTYNLIGDCSTHDGCHYATEGMRDALRALADSFYARYERRVEYNDISLVQGGIFDLDNDYSPAHDEHRRGTDCDFRTHGPNPLTSAQLRYVRTRWNALSTESSDRAIHDETGTDQPHYHIRY
ncbi:MAG: hypothetical protein GWN99_00610 [Gemmatimonadetes bacterium]|uniref:Uncharacterized protein n=1 Tax=Candidatus Kutchimonas denitrificans TaxID=3056748 RepID=A0AAE4Z5A9_9BACT|nr:hypothetical protein [Candidatus Kutchimonas denitrificans]NIR99568.1 hypothetical protein [Gemmatimonadota bacterium]NIT65188.1 hypothetical protein [Gemmatimonadota bacterium]NIV23721.1 hypothetical protein [Gemmatimonadota bacterium]NIY33767.1 hypothetical protein [Gemmatimonadota bacterium]